MNRQSSKQLALSFMIALLASTPSPTLAQLPVVGVLLFEPPPPGESPTARQLKGLGQREGQTYAMESRYARGDNSRFPALARELLDRGPAVIVTSCGPPLRAIRKLNSTVPVIAGCADPKNFFGEVENLSRPGRRTTGFTFLAPESAAKRLQLLKELLPSLSRVGVLHYQHDDWSTYFEEMDRAALQLGLTLSRLPIARAEELDDAFVKAVQQGVKALVVFPDATTIGTRAQIATLAIKHKLPSMFDTRRFVVDGGLISYGPDWPAFALPVIASYVDKILKGAAPGDLPIQQPTRLELVVNLRVASVLGINVPKSFLIRADHILR